MKKKILYLLFALLCNKIGVSQTPDGPLINSASQVFLENGNFHSERFLAVSQYISPRVIRPGAGNLAEKVIVMYIGHWLDITDEVVVTAPNSNVTSGVTFSRILEKKNGPCNTIYTNHASVLPNYNGAHVVVEFMVTKDAAIGTHTVKLRRPRAGFGKDESIPFYLEVMNEERIHTIKFRKDGDDIFKSSARKNETGVVSISGQNLGSIRLDRNINRLNENGFFSNISDPYVSDNYITFRATLIKTGNIGYDQIMPANLKNAEYPKGGYLRNNIIVYPGILDVNPERVQTVSTTCEPLPPGVRTPISGNPPPQPRLTISFLNAFKSYGDVLKASEVAAFSLCPANNILNETKITTISNQLIVRVQNAGAGASSATTLYICTLGNSNFNPVTNVNVPALGPGGIFEFPIPRRENRVISIIASIGSPCVRGRSGLQGINRWSDLGVQASLYYRTIAGSFEVNSTVRD
ncbi:MAG: hypothetical protein WBC06_05955 [Chitinophagaceae bacterium]